MGTLWETERSPANYIAGLIDWTALSGFNVHLDKKMQVIIVFPLQQIFPELMIDKKFYDTKKKLQMLQIFVTNAAHDCLWVVIYFLWPFVLIYFLVLRD